MFCAELQLEWSVRPVCERPEAARRPSRAAGVRGPAFPPTSFSVLDCRPLIAGTNGAASHIRSEPPRCRCTDVTQDPPCNGPTWCFNGCRGKGRCVKNTCVCDDGYWWGPLLSWHHSRSMCSTAPGVFDASRLTPTQGPGLLQHAVAGRPSRQYPRRRPRVHCARCSDAAAFPKIRLLLRWALTAPWPRRSRRVQQRRALGSSCMSSRRGCRLGTSASRG